MAERLMHGRAYVEAAWPAEPGDVVDWLDHGRVRTCRVLAQLANSVVVEAPPRKTGVLVERRRVRAVWRRKT
jgi:hypothetical protein